MTNKEKFKEVFGFTPNPDAECLLPVWVCDSQNGRCLAPGGDDCPFADWWNDEYKPCFKLIGEDDEQTV